MVSCSVRKCKNRSVKGCKLRFFPFPKDKTLANTWLQYCRPTTNCRTGIICSAHFVSSDYERNMKFRFLKSDAVPSLFLDETSLWPIKVLNDSSDPSMDCILLDTESQILSNNLEPVHYYKSTTGTHHSIETQTDKSLCADTVTIPAKEYKELTTVRSNYDLLYKNLQRIFTPGQMLGLMKPEADRCRLQWSTEDIAAAATLRDISHNAYKYLIETLGIPLPRPGTIVKWLKTNRANARARENGGEQINEV